MSIRQTWDNAVDPGTVVSEQKKKPISEMELLDCKDSCMGCSFCWLVKYEDGSQVKMHGALGSYKFFVEAWYYAKPYFKKLYGHNHDQYKWLQEQIDKKGYGIDLWETSLDAKKQFATPVHTAPDMPDYKNKPVADIRMVSCKASNVGHIYHLAVEYKSGEQILFSGDSISDNMDFIDWPNINEYFAKQGDSARDWAMRNIEIRERAQEVMTKHGISLD